VQERDPSVGAVSPEQAGADRPRDAEADGAPDERAEHASHGGLPQPALEENDQPGKSERKPDIGGKGDREWLEDGRGVRDGGHEQTTR